MNVESVTSEAANANAALPQPATNEVEVPVVELQLKWKPFAALKIVAAPPPAPPSVSH